MIPGRFEYEYRVTEYEHETESKMWAMTSPVERIYKKHITYIADTWLCLRSRGWPEPPWLTSRRGSPGAVRVSDEV